MSSASPKRILIVDDDRQLGTMLAELLETEGYVCAVATNGAAGLQLAARQAPDLMVLDVMMPGQDGIATLAELRQYSDIPVLMLTAMAEDDDRILGLETGADDYLAKPFVPRELLLRIAAILKRVAARDAVVSDPGRVFHAGPLQVEPGKHRAVVNGTSLALTDAELRILEALMVDVGAVVSRERLTEFALGRALTPYDRALDTHISHLRRKLAASDGGERCAIRSVRGAGYRLIVD